MTAQPRDVADLPRRIREKFAIEDGCWLWTAHLNHAGYGRVSLEGSMQLAHRAVYTLLVGAIPEGMHLDHLCRVRRCVNPAHLEPVTQRENTLRSTSHIAQIAARQTCPSGHPYTPENLYVSPRGYRVCRTCSRIHSAVPKSCPTCGVVVRRSSLSMHVRRWHPEVAR